MTGTTRRHAYDLHIFYLLLLKWAYAFTFGRYNFSVERTWIIEINLIEVLLYINKYKIVIRTRTEINKYNSIKQERFVFVICDALMPDNYN